MNIVFEVGGKQEVVADVEQTGETKDEVVARLRLVLDEAGVEYARNLGIVKLQKLVDEINPVE